MSAGTEDTQPNGRDREFQAVNARLKRIESELHGGPGTNGLKADMAVVASNQATMLSEMREMRAEFRNAAAQLNESRDPKWFYPFLAAVLAALVVAALVAAARYAAIL